METSVFPGTMHCSPSRTARTSVETCHFHCSSGGRESGFLLPLLDLSLSNKSILDRPFHVLTITRELKCVCQSDWFNSTDLDAYFHIPVISKHRKFLHFLFSRAVDVEGSPDFTSCLMAYLWIGGSSRYLWPGSLSWKGPLWKGVAGGKNLRLLMRTRSENYVMQQAEARG